METITTDCADKIAALIDQARQLDEQVAAFAEALRRVQRDATAELQEQPFYTEDYAEDADANGAVDDWYETVRVVELRDRASAMEHRLEAAIDDLVPGSRLHATVRDRWASYGIGGFAIDQEGQA